MLLRAKAWQPVFEQYPRSGCDRARRSLFRGQQRCPCRWKRESLRDIETINLELIFSDLEILERRIAKVAKAARMDKEQAKELAMLERVKERLEDGKLAIGFETEDEERKNISRT